MNTKKLFIVLCLLLCVLSLSAVSAVSDDNGTDTTQSNQVTDVEDTLGASSNEVIEVEGSSDSGVVTTYNESDDESNVAQNVVSEKDNGLLKASGRRMTFVKFPEDKREVTRTAVDWNAGERGTYVEFRVYDSMWDPVAYQVIQIGINGKIYNVSTDKYGKAGIQINLAKATVYTYAIAFLGNDDYYACFDVIKLTIVKKSTSITPKKTSYTFKSSAKPKYVEATLKTTNKYLSTSGKKVTLVINGKTYTTSVGKNGAIKFNLGSFTKKGTYKVTIKYAGDGTYKGSTSKQITIKIT